MFFMTILLSLVNFTAQSHSGGLPATIGQGFCYNSKNCRAMMVNNRNSSRDKEDYKSFFLVNGNETMCENFQRAIDNLTQRTYLQEQLILELIHNLTVMQQAVFALTLSSTFEKESCVDNDSDLLCDNDGSCFSDTDSDSICDTVDLCPNGALNKVNCTLNDASRLEDNELYVVIAALAATIVIVMVIIVTLQCRRQRRRQRRTLPSFQMPTDTGFKGVTIALEALSYGRNVAQKAKARHKSRARILKVMLRRKNVDMFSALCREWKQSLRASDALHIQRS